MKTIQSTTRLALSALAIFCAAGSAMAENRVSITHGSACKLDGVPGKFLKDIASRASGTSNVNLTDARNVVCPISRTQSTNSNILVSVDGRLDRGGKIVCSIQSRVGRTVLASKPFERTSGGGTESFTANTTFVASEIPTDAALSLFCTLPPAEGATVISIRVLEQTDF